MWPDFENSDSAGLMICVQGQMWTIGCNEFRLQGETGDKVAGVAP